MKKYFAGILSFTLLASGALLFFRSHFAVSAPPSSIPTTPAQTLQTVGRAVYAKFSPDGKVLAVVAEPNVIPQTGTYSVELWDTRTWKRQRTLPLTNYFIYFALDSKTLFCAADTVQEWNLAAGRLIYTYKDSGYIVTFSSDRRFFAATQPITNREKILIGSTLAVWDTASHKRLWEAATPSFISLDDATFSPDDHILAEDSNDPGGDDPHGRLTFWNVKTGQRIAGPDRNPLGVQQTAFSPDSKLFAMTGRGLPLTLWDTSTWKQKWSVASGFDRPQDIRISSAGRIAVVGRNEFPAAESREGVTLCQTASGSIVQQIPDAAEPEFLDNGKLLVTLEGNGIAVWQASTGTKTAEYTVSSHLDNPVLSPDDKYLVTTQPDSGTVSVWNIPDQH